MSILFFRLSWGSKISFLLFAFIGFVQNSLRPHAQTVLSRTELTRERFHRWLSKRQTKFLHMLRKNVMDIRPDAQPARNEIHRCPSQCGNDLIADWFSAETTLLLTESTQKRLYCWLSQRRNDFIADWVNAEMIFSLNQRGNFPENNFAGQAAPSSYTASSQPIQARREASMSFLLRPSSHS
jgi:hypothetical protein